MRRLLRVLTLLGVSASVLFAVPTWSYAEYIGQRGDPHPLGLVNTILIFVVAPLGVFLVLAALCLRPQKGVGALRYRPGRAWTYGSAWFGTQEPVASESESALSPGSGGASGSW